VDDPVPGSPCGALCPRMVYDNPVTGCPTASRMMDFDQC
jgi:hypothetical protein